MAILLDSSFKSTGKNKLPLTKCTAAIVLSLYMGLNSAQAAGLDGLPFPPDYPAGPSYNTFAATLEGFGLVTDAEGDGLQNDRCSANGEAEQQIVLAAANVLLVPLAKAADAVIEPISRAVLFTANIVAEELVVATEISIAQCDHQDGSVNAAEIEASYENTVTLLMDLVAHDDNLDTHDDNLATHDAEIKAILDIIVGKVDLLIGGQAETHRLLHTPNGTRTSEYYADACGDGDGCEWNDK